MFDIDVETSMQRVGKEKTGRKRGKEFHNRVRNGYLEIAKQEPERIKVIDASMSIEEIHEEVKKVIDFYLNYGKHSQ